MKTHPIQLPLIVAKKCVRFVRDLYTEVITVLLKPAPSPVLTTGEEGGGGGQSDCSIQISWLGKLQFIRVTWDLGGLPKWQAHFWGVSSLLNVFDMTLMFTVIIIRQYDNVFLCLIFDNFLRAKKGIMIFVLYGNHNYIHPIHKISSSTDYKAYN